MIVATEKMVEIQQEFCYGTKERFWQMNDGFAICKSLDERRDI